MKLPQSLTTVTSFSKALAILLFFILILGSFEVGVKFGEKRARILSPQNSPPVLTPQQPKETDSTNLAKYFDIYQSQDIKLYQSKNYHYQIAVPKEITLAIHGGSLEKEDTWIDINKKETLQSMNFAIVDIRKRSLAQQIRDSFTFTVDGKIISNLHTPLKPVKVNGLDGYEYEASMEGGRAKWITLQKGSTAYMFFWNTEGLAENEKTEKGADLFWPVVNSFVLLPEPSTNPSR